MGRRKTWTWTTNRREAGAIFLGAALFWSLLLLPPPSSINQGTLLLVLLKSFSRIPSAITAYFEYLMGIYQRYSWEIFLQSAAESLLTGLIISFFWIGIAAAVSQATWIFWPARWRLFAWDILGVCGLIGCALIAVFVFIFNLGQWPAENSHELWISLHGTVMLGFFVVTSLLYGHFGSILFARERKSLS